MDDLILSIIASSLIFLGGGAAFLMFEIRGNPKDREVNQKLIRWHKILGYIFMTIFALMSVGMIRKAGAHPGELHPRILLHGALGLALICLLAVKLLIARRQKKLAEKLFGIGLVILTMTFVMMAITAGHHFQHMSESHHDIISEADGVVKKDQAGRRLLEKKCTKCHELDQVFATSKSKDEWAATVARMVEYAGDPNYLSEDEKMGITAFLLNQQ